MNVYSGLIGEENTYLYRTSLYLAASASAEFFADIALSPMESCKVRMQTSIPGTFPTTLRKAAPQIYAEEGLNGFYKSLVPLWGRQIPYTMMKFACFERTVEAIYQYVVPKPRAECSKGEQLIVTFAAGYIAGVFCAIVSHPADTIVSYMNKSQGSTVGSAAKALGFSGMWAGLGPRIIMIGPLTALQWFIYDGVKVALALPRPPPPAMPESLKKNLSPFWNGWPPPRCCSSGSNGSSPLSNFCRISSSVKTSLAAAMSINFFSARFFSSSSWKLSGCHFWASFL